MWYILGWQFVDILYPNFGSWTFYIFSHVCSKYCLTLLNQSNIKISPPPASCNHSWTWALGIERYIGTEEDFLEQRGLIIFSEAKNKVRDLYKSKKKKSNTFVLLFNSVNQILWYLPNFYKIVTFLPTKVLSDQRIWSFFWWANTESLGMFASWFRMVEEFKSRNNLDSFDKFS